MKQKAVKVIAVLLGIAVLLLLAGWAAVYYLAGINYIALKQTFTYSDIKQAAALYNAKDVLLIDSALFKEYGTGRFPKYKIYNPHGQQLNIYECYESLPILQNIITQNKDSVVSSSLFADEIAKSRSLNSDTTWRQNVWQPGKYNMIFYYRIAMNRKQLKQLNNIIQQTTPYYRDSLNVIYINTDKVTF